MVNLLRNGIMASIFIAIRQVIAIIFLLQNDCLLIAYEGVAEGLERSPFVRKVYGLKHVSGSGWTLAQLYLAVAQEQHVIALEERGGKERNLPYIADDSGLRRSVLHKNTGTFCKMRTVYGKNQAFLS